MSCEGYGNRLVSLLSWEGAEAGEQLKEAREELFEIIPELRAEEGFQQNNRYHVYDVWEHTVEALRYADEDIILRLAVLLHDVGKPRCYTEDDNGTGHFYGHGAVSEKIAGEVLDRLGFEQDTREMVMELVKYHDAEIHGKSRTVRSWLNRLGELQLRRLLKVQRCDIRGQNPEWIKERLQRADQLEAMVDQAVVRSGLFGVKDLAVSGQDLMQLGYEPGPELGQALRELAELVGRGELDNDRAALLEKARPPYL